MAYISQIKLPDGTTYDLKDYGMGNENVIKVNSSKQLVEVALDTNASQGTILRTLVIPTTLLESDGLTVNLIDTHVDCSVNVRGDAIYVRNNSINNEIYGLDLWDKGIEVFKDISDTYTTLFKVDDTGKIKSDSLTANKILVADANKNIVSSSLAVSDLITTSNIGSQSVNYATSAGSANPNDNVLANNANLNNITTVGFYSVGGGNSVTNKPSGVLHFGMIVTHNAAGNYYTQIIPDTESGKVYIRFNKAGTWTSWKTLIDADGGTMTGRLTLKGTAASALIVTRGIAGSDGYGNIGELYLNAQNDYNTYFGKNGESYLGTSGSISLGANKVFAVGNRSKFTDLNTASAVLCANNGAFIRRYDNNNTAAQINASAFNTASSRLVKENIRPIDDDIVEKVLSLDVKSFDYNGKTRVEKNQIGMIAEDVLDILPQFVHVPENYDEEETKQRLDNGEFADTLSIDYSNFVPALIKIVQMQQQQIDELKRRIEE